MNKQTWTARTRKELLVMQSKSTTRISKKLRELDDLKKRKREKTKMIVDELMRGTRGSVRTE